MELKISNLNSRVKINNFFIYFKNILLIFYYFYDI